jgi:hypothetical protein
MVLGALRQEYTSMFNLPPPGSSFASAAGLAVPPQRNVRKGSFEPVTGIGEQRHGKGTENAQLPPIHLSSRTCLLCSAVYLCSTPSSLPSV